MRFLADMGVSMRVVESLRSSGSGAELYQRHPDLTQCLFPLCSVCA
jgi:hypothetical protein